MCIMECEVEILDYEDVWSNARFLGSEPQIAVERFVAVRHSQEHRIYALAA